MKKLLSSVAAFIMVALVATSCGLLAPKSTVVDPATTESAKDGKLVGTILKTIYDQYSKDGVIDTGNVKNIVNMAQLAGVLAKVKNLVSGTSDYADFAKGIVTGTKNKISTDKTDAVIKALGSLAGNVDLSQLAGLATKAGAQAAVAAQEPTKELVETAKSVASIMQLFGE